MKDWLDRFVEHGSFGEANPQILWWSGVVTIASALRRKVWVDEINFEWTPNFYVVIVAPPGVVAKSTTVDMGLKMVRQLDNVTIGPKITSWQALLDYMEVNAEVVAVPGFGDMQMTCVTVAVSELGTFLDPRDRFQTDVLVDLWDGRRETLDKLTKGNGNNHIENPWISFVGGTTRAWIAENFTEYSLQAGLFSRIVFLYADRKEKLVALPHKHVPPNYLKEREKLVADLRKIADYAGEMRFTPAAESWMDAWYADLWGGVVEDKDGRITRMQTHLVKLSMVLSAARREFPWITDTHLQLAAQRLEIVEKNAGMILSLVGQTPISRAAREIVEYLQANGPQKEATLYRNAFMRKMSFTEFKEAMGSAIEGNLAKRDVQDGEWFAFPLEIEDETCDTEITIGETSPAPATKLPGVPEDGPAIQEIQAMLASSKKKPRATKAQSGKIAKNDPH